MKLSLENLPGKSIGFSLFFSYEFMDRKFLVLAGGISRDYNSKSKEVKIIEVSPTGLLEVVNSNTL